MKYLGIAFLMMLLLYGITFAQTDSIDYLGQKSPEYYPEKFADGIISSGKGESGPVFSPGGNELFFTGYDSQKYIYYINYMKKTNGVWSERMPAPFSDYKNGSSEAVPCFTPDGKRIYYSSNRKGGFGKLDIWYVDKTDTGWGSPVNAGDIINSAGNDDFPFISGDGSLYFNSDREKVEWDYDIFYAKCHDGKYSIATNLGDSVNSSSWDACPTIVNDKLIFWSKRSGGFGKGDIYFSRISGDSFGKAELMSANYNSSSSEFGLVLSPDKKYFFFSRGDGDINSKIYWVDAEALNYLGVREAPFNYITSWYGGNSAQMEQALHPKLVKRRIVNRCDVRNVTYDWMINAVKSGIGKIDNIKQAQKDIRILDQTENIASAKVTSNEYVDYLHLVKFNNQWKIVNALWEYKTTPENGTAEEAKKIANKYADSWHTGDTSIMSAILLPDYAGRMALSLTEVENVDYSWMITEKKNITKIIVKEIKVLDACLNMASVKISYDGYVEYLHLSYVNNKWYIVNSLRNFQVKNKNDIKEDNNNISIKPYIN